MTLIGMINDDFVVPTSLDISAFILKISVISVL